MGPNFAVRQEPAFWAAPLKATLSRPLDPLTSSDHHSDTNVTFVCAGAETVEWNGLAYLAGLSKVFKARSEEEQCFTVLLPEYEGGTVRKMLGLMSSGEVWATQQEMGELVKLAKALGVSVVFKFFLQVLFMDKLELIFCTVIKCKKK